MRSFEEIISFFLLQLPVICAGLGKKNFKAFLEMFFDHIFYALVSFLPCTVKYFMARFIFVTSRLCVQECDNQLTSAAADECLVQLGTQLGPSILRGRVEAYDARFKNTST